MIGYNDPHGSGKNEIFTVADAQAVTQFAQQTTSACSRTGTCSATRKGLGITTTSAR
jgi:hypothetical protein